jgi:predicted nucleic acid-binding protein
MPYRAFLDANILVPARVRDVILTLAEADIYQVHWSPGVLDEMVKHLPDSMRPDQVDALLDAMNRAFPDANSNAVTTIPAEVSTAINAKDQHVVAAAVNTHADVLVTDDETLRDEIDDPAFKPTLDAQSADVFLTYALDVFPAVSTDVLRQLVRERWGHPDLDDAEIHARLLAWMRRSGLTAAAGQLEQTWLNTT